MIKNDKQLTVTQKQLQLLSEALRRVESQPADDLLTRARKDALKFDIRKLNDQVKEYLEVKQGAVSLPALTDVEQLGESLVRARVALGMTQEQLAKALGQKPQQVQRYERQLYSKASLKMVRRVAAVVLEPSARKTA
jgi:ribosome-binding protein aMBF1 (putative translation factor)